MTTLTNGGYTSTSFSALKPLVKAPFESGHFGVPSKVGRNVSRNLVNDIAPKKRPLVS
jgi:hypothetical protein